MSEFASTVCRPLRLEASVENGISTVVDAVFLETGTLVRTTVSWQGGSVRAHSTGSHLAVSTEWLPGLSHVDFGLER